MNRARLLAECDFERLWRGPIARTRLGTNLNGRLMARRIPMVVVREISLGRQAWRAGAGGNAADHASGRVAVRTDGDVNHSMDVGWGRSPESSRTKARPKWANGCSVGCLARSREEARNLRTILHRLP